MDVFPNEMGRKMTQDDIDSMEKGYQKFEESLPQLDDALHTFETQKFVIQREGKQALLGGIALDITERKQAEEALRSKMALLEAQKNATLDGLLVVDENQKRILVNQQLVEIFEIPESALETDDDSKMLGHVVGLMKNPEAFLEKVKYLYEQKHEISRDEIELLNGMILDRYSAPVVGEDGTTYGRIWSFRDITEQKRSEANILHARDEAEKANKAKSEFLSRMSHELRTPMNSILGFAQLLEMSELNAKQTKGVKNILNSGRHLLDLINEVLDISRIEAGRISLSLEPVAIVGLLEESIDVVRPQMNEKMIEIEVRSSFDTRVFVQADRQRLKQVLLNLLNNAIKYNSDGGTIKVKVDSMSAIDEGMVKLRIAITDTGKGIPEDDIKKLFTPFERIGAEKTLTEGTGLGLAVSKKLMDAMGGTIGVESIPGEGSTFWIELTHYTYQAEKSHVKDLVIDVPIEIGYVEGTILYVEDNISNIELVEEILSNHLQGIKLISIMNGTQALEMAIGHKPDMILLDLNLPDMHGHDVLKMLQADDNTLHIPVIIISADAMPHQIDRLMTAGAKDYLPKPLDLKSFLAVIDKWLKNNN